VIQATHHRFTSLVSRSCAHDAELARSMSRTICRGTKKLITGMNHAPIVQPRLGTEARGDSSWALRRDRTSHTRNSAIARVGLSRRPVRPQRTLRRSGIGSDRRTRCTTFGSSATGCRYPTADGRQPTAPAADSTPIREDAVEREATGPNSAGSAHNTPLSTRQPPPRAPPCETAPWPSPQRGHAGTSRCPSSPEECSFPDDTQDPRQAPSPQIRGTPPLVRSPLGHRGW
jgi:hypothetical protein